MRLSILKSTGSVIFLSFVIFGCADIQVAKDAYKSGNYELAEKNYKELSKRGFPEGYKGLGDISLHKQNEELSLKYYMQAYDEGYLNAAADIAKIKLQYASTDEEYKDAYRWLLKAKKQNSDYINFKIAVMKLEGKGVKQNIDEALNEIKKLCEKNYPQANFYLANLYEEGKYVPLSYEKALKYYKKAYSGGIENSKIKMADIYANRQSGFYDRDKAVSIYKEYAQLGNAYASYQIAKLYSDNIPKALPWYEKSAKDGYLPAMLKIELFRFEGYYVKQDKATALENLQNMSQKGFSAASVALGSIYHSGTYLKKDDKKALEYFKKAYKQGDDRAAIFMAEIYAQKNSPLRDDAKAKAILEKDNSFEAKNMMAEFYEQRGMDEKAKELYVFCARHGYMPSRFALAKMQNDIKTIEELSKSAYSKATLYLADMAKNSNELQKALKLYEKAYYQGSKNAMLKVADIYAYTTLKNLSKAKGIYKSYADREHVIGMYKLAKFLETQDGTSKEVVKLYEKSAKMGYVPAIIKLGDMYLNANGVEFDTKKALAYYKEAYSMSYEDAELKIASILYNGYGITPQKAKAKEIYIKHAKMGNYKAAYILASIYEAEGDVNKALYWYDYASKNGYADAKYRLALLIQKNDPIKANRLLKEAAFGNHSKAQIEYGKNLFYGYGIEKNQFEGLKMLYMALFNKEDAIDIIMQMIDDIDNLKDVISAYKAAKKEKESL